MTSQQRDGPTIADYYRMKNRISSAERNAKWMFQHSKEQVKEANIALQAARKDLLAEYRALQFEVESKEIAMFTDFWSYISKIDHSDGLTRSDFSDATTNATSEAHPAPEDGTNGTA